MGPVERRVVGGLRATGWVARRLVAAAVVVGLVLFEAMLWSLTNLRVTGDDFCIEHCRPGRLPGPFPDLQPHPALFWLTNGVLAAVLVLAALILRLRRRRGMGP